MMKCRILLLGFSCWITGISAQNLSKTLIFDGQTRSYRIYIPAVYNASNPVPLVLALHGLGDNANNFQGVGFNQIADTANFIAVYPNALADPLLQGTAWNTGIYPGNSSNDVGFLNALLDTILHSYSVDTNRIYCTGFSLGGFMTYRMACESGERFAAVASVAGSLPAPSIATCYAGKAMPVLHIHGTSDQTIPFNFGTIYIVVTNLGADSTTHFWARHNGCEAAARHDSIANTKNDGLTFEKYSYTSCSDSSEVLLYKANGMQHTWPMASNDVNATKEIWNFFSRHHKISGGDTTNTGLAEIAPDFIISPNPASHKVSVMSSFSGSLQVVLTDLSGKELYRDESADSFHNLALDNLKEGIYLLALTAQQKTTLKKLVVIR